MRARIAAVFALALGALVSAPSCSGTSETTKPDTLCDPGENIFCRCPGGEPGTKTCKADGQSFEECTTELGACSTCGNGQVEGNEECDDGNDDDSDACLRTCTEARCGDGIVQAGVEACDDGNDVDDDACSNACQPGSGCGNGQVDPGEDCDDGNSSNDDACTSECVAATCGDGYVQQGVEQCDDGNQVDDDSCSNACALNQPATYGCPGTEVAVAAGVDTTLTGDATPAKDEYVGTCGGDLAPEVVYAVTPADTGTLTVTMAGMGDTDPILYARKDDCAGGAELGCSDQTFGGGTESIAFPVVAGTTYYVFADGWESTSGPYTLTLHLQTKVEGDTCPGIAVSLYAMQDEVLTGDTSTASPNYKGSSACVTSASTNEIVYAVTPAADGTVTALLDPTYDGQLYARSGSCTTGTQIACSEAGGAGTLEEISFPVTAGTKYSVFVDGNAGASGAYQLLLHLE